MSDNKETHTCVSGLDLFLGLLLLVFVLGFGYAAGRKSRNKEINEMQSLYDKISTKLYKLENDGVGIQTVGLEFQFSEKSAGVRVSKVLPGTSAAKAGIFVGDIILSVYGISAEEYHPALPFSSSYNLGKQIPVEVRRGDRILHMKLTPEILLQKIVLTSK